MLNLKQNYENLLQTSTKKAIEFCTIVADETNLPIFLVGGAVRDLILKIPCYDIDITVQGNAIDFAKNLAEKYPNDCELVETHEDFKTAKVCFNFDNEKMCFDFASTRQESYKSPASLPYVEKIGCELYSDVIRRDFSINAMAVSLNSNTFGELTDYLNGYEDLTNKKLRILHDKSFIDDPTRIIRGLKFSIRFGLELDEHTKILQENCLNSGQFDNLASERIKQELKQTLNLNSKAAFCRIIDENIYRLIDANISKNISLAENAELITEKFTSHLKSNENVWLIYFGVLLKNCEDIKEFALKFNLNSHETQVIAQTKEIFSERDLLNDSISNYEVYKILAKYTKESVLSLLITEKTTVLISKIELFLNKLCHIKIETSGNDLIKLGFKPDKKFGEILEKLLELKLNKEIFDKNDELNFIKELYT